MEDALKAGGVMTGVGLGAVAVMLGWRVYHDDAMSWFVVVAVTAAFVLAVLAVVLVLVHRVLVAWAIALTRSAEERLMTARGYRTLGQDGPTQPGRGLLEALIAGQDTSNVVDGDARLTWPASPALTGGGDDHGDN